MSRTASAQAGFSGAACSTFSSASSAHPRVSLPLLEVAVIRTSTVLALAAFVTSSRSAETDRPAIGCSALQTLSSSCGTTWVWIVLTLKL